MDKMDDKNENKKSNENNENPNDEKKSDTEIAMSTLFQNLSPDEIIDYFYSNKFPLRTFKDLLLKCSEKNKSDIEELRTLLIKGFSEYKGLSPANIRVTVDGWLNGTHEPDDRKDLIMICFALGMHEKNADLFLRHTADGGFHLRNPQEAAIFYCLKNGKSYSETMEFTSELRITYNSEDAYSEERLTELVSNAFRNISSDDDFIMFINANRNIFGKLHNTAYKNFKNYYDELVKPYDLVEQEEAERMSVKDVVEIYLRMGVPKLHAYHNALQKMIHRYWPDETSVKRIKSRDKDVTRKLLLLLYVVTEGIGADSIRKPADKKEAAPLTEKKDYDYLEYASTEEFMAEHANKISDMLTESGFAAIDPRNPFDWLIFYCLIPDKNNPDSNMSEKLQQVLEILFDKTQREP